MKDAPSVTLNKLYFSVHVSHARLMRTTPHEWGQLLKERLATDSPLFFPAWAWKRSTGLGILHRAGFVPAHAGKSHNATRVAHLPGDHSQVGWLPPSCVPYHYPEKDSSPLTQGIPVGYGDRVRIPGIIPANAGNTWPTGRTVSTRADHPCLRGEHTV